MPFVPRPVKERLTLGSSIDPVTGCWNWMGNTRQTGGYGSLKHKGVKWRAHRLSYSVFVGDIPKGLWICHKCDNPRCINPRHLFLGTALDNNRDMVSKGRDRRCIGVNNGTSVLTEQNVRDILVQLKIGLLSQEKIAKMFGVTQMVISKIHTNKMWKHIKR